MASSDRLICERESITKEEPIRKVKQHSSLMRLERNARFLQCQKKIAERGNMYRWIYLCVLCGAVTVFGTDYKLEVSKASGPPQGTLQPVPISLEYAETPQQISWG